MRLSRQLGELPQDLSVTGRVPAGGSEVRRLRNGESNFISSFLASPPTFSEPRSSPKRALARVKTGSPAETGGKGDGLFREPIKVISLVIRRSYAEYGRDRIQLAANCEIRLTAQMTRPSIYITGDPI